MDFGGTRYCHTDASGTWGACRPECPGNLVPDVKCSYNLVNYLVIEGCKTACEFPFTYNGIQHDACITHDNDGTPWCDIGDGEKTNCIGDCEGNIVQYHYNEDQPLI